MKKISSCFLSAALAVFVLAPVNNVFADAAPQVVGASVVVPSTVFATVGDSVISFDEYDAAFSAAARSKFYHGKPPENEVAKLQREVGDKLVTRILLLREAGQKGLRPDADAIKSTVQTYEQRYASSEQWKKNREQALPPLVARLEQDDLLSQLEKMVRASVEPSDEQVLAYYFANKEKFTEPEQLRISVILLKVDPSSPSETWQKADEQAKALVVRARAGEEFAALARQYSNDGTAPQGGDMGYLHTGMLAEGTQEPLTKLKIGDITDSIRLLEGYAVFNLTGRKESKFHEFEKVKGRAKDLAQRDQSDSAWLAFVADLKAKSTFQVNQSHFLPLVQ